MKRLFFLMILVLSIFLAPLAQAQVYWNGTIDKSWTGTGTAQDPILISTAEQLAGFADSVNRGDDFSGRYIELTADIYLSDSTLGDSLKHEWTHPIGQFQSGGQGWEYTLDTAWFRGNFDGKNHVIYNLFHGTTPDAPDWDDPDNPLGGMGGPDFSGWAKALFGFVEDATIKNVRLENAVVTGASCIATLALEVSGNSVIENCHATGVVMNIDPDYGGPAGGLIATLISGQVINCSANVDAYASRGAGGLIGHVYANGIVRNCSALGLAHCTQYNAGGLAGSNAGLIENSHASGRVSRAYYYHAYYDCGGFVGTNVQDAIIRNCSAKGDVHLYGQNGGGFVGLNRGHIESCYCTGDVHDETDGFGSSASAFCGMNGSNTSSIYDDDTPGTLINCFATGKTDVRNELNLTGYPAGRPSNGFLNSYGDRLGKIINCSYRQVRPDTLMGIRGGVQELQESYMKSQAFVDELNMFAAIYGSSTWEYRAGDYPVPTGVNATNITDYLAGGSGTEEDPYRISNKKELMNFATYVNKGYDFRGEYVKLTADIELNRPQSEWGEEMPTQWVPIGRDVNWEAYDNPNRVHNYYFRGNFDGDFHEIRNLYCDDMDNNTGFFGNVWGAYVGNVHIKNLGVVGVYLNSGNYCSAGGIVCYSQGKTRLTQCWTSGIIDSRAGNHSGLVGGFNINGSLVMKNCYSSADTKGDAVAVNSDGMIIYEEDSTTMYLGNFLYYGARAKNASLWIGQGCYDAVYYNKDSAEVDYPQQGASSTKTLQSIDFVNKLNYYVDCSNSKDSVQLCYWKYNEAAYPTFTSTAPGLTVSFESNGGNAIVQQHIYPNTHAIRPNDPVKEGHAFGGWYSDEALTEVFEFDKVVLSSNIKLYAQWIPLVKPDYSIFQNPFATTYTIRTKEQLYGFACAMNGVEGVLDASTFEGKTVKLGNDILIQDTTDWQYWGKVISALPFPSMGGSGNIPFQGTFDGQGYSIAGLFINPTDNASSIQGCLFNCIGEKGVVKNTNFNATVLYGVMQNAGVLTGKLDGTVDNCHIRGMACHVRSKITRNTAEGYLNLGNLGGMVGSMYRAEATITNSSVNMTVEGYKTVGGLVGIMQGGTIRNCHVVGQISALTEGVGGFIGGNDNLEADISIDSCTMRGKVFARTDWDDDLYIPKEYMYVGGFIPSSNHYGDFKVTNCYVYADVIGSLRSDWDCTGGFFGANKRNGIYEYCGFEGTVTGKNYVSGFCVEGNSLKYCYAKGIVTGEQYVSGFCASGYRSYYSISQCFFEGEVRGKMYVNGFSGATTGIYDSYARAHLVGDDYVAGFAQSTGNVGGTNLALRNYAACTIDCAGENKTGFVLNGLDTQTRDVYYDSELSGMSGAQAGTNPRTTSQMKQVETYKNWNFEDIWGIRDTINDGYPILKCFYPNEFYVISVDDVTMDRGTTFQLLPVVKHPSDYTGGFVYATSDSTIATVSETGLISATMQCGRCKISVATPDNKGFVMIDCYVKGVNADSVVLSHKGTIDVPLGGTVQISAKVYPTEASQVVGFYATNNTYNYISIDDNGIITGLQLGGSPQVYARTLDGPSRSSELCNVKVYDPNVIQTVTCTLSKDTISMGETSQIMVSVFPEQVTNYTVEYSTYSRYVTVDANGVISVKEEPRGEYSSQVIRVDVKQGNKSISREITIILKKSIVPITKLSFLYNSISMTKGETKSVNVSVEPGRDYWENIIWSSSNEKVVIIEEQYGNKDYCLIKALAAGKATITATSEVGGISASCEVTVTSNDFFTITFVNEDGTVLQTGQVREGEMPVYNSDTLPTKATTAEYTYTFAGWTPDLMPVTADATYTATYHETKRSYQIRFLNYDGAVLQSSLIEYGTMPEYTGKTPTRPSTAQYNYNFDAWSPEVVSVTTDADYTANFTSVIRQYTVTFLDWDGTELSKQLLDYATPATVPADPTREGYTFKGWDKDFSNVQSDLIVTAQYEKIIIYYTITFVNEDGTVLQTSQVAEGEMPVYTGETPMKATTVEYSYTFIGWTPELVRVTTDATYTATYTATKRKYQIHFLNYNGTELQSSQVEYGALPEYAGETPVRPSTAQYNYVFDGWTPEIVIVTEAANYTATYTSFLRQYTVTFLDWDGTKLSEQVVDYGSAAVAPADPVREGYTFKGWDKDFSNVQSDLTVTALYEQNPVTTEPIVVRLNPASAPSWSTVYLYAWDINQQQLAGTWPGTKVSKDAKGWWIYTFDSNLTNVNIIWTNGTGEQTIDIIGVTQSTCYDLDRSMYPYSVFVVDCTTNTALENIDIPQARKVIIDNRLYILLPDGTCYDAFGYKVE